MHLLLSIPLDISNDDQLATLLAAGFVSHSQFVALVRPDQVDKILGHAFDIHSDKVNLDARVRALLVPALSSSQVIPDSPQPAPTPLFDQAKQRRKARVK